MLVIILPITPFKNLEHLFNSLDTLSTEIRLSITLKKIFALLKSLETLTLEIVIIPLPSKLKSFNMKSLKMILISLLSLSCLL